MKIILPRTDSIQEIAKFWDELALTDFEDELEEVTEPIFAPDQVLTLRLPRGEAARVEAIAQAKGVSVDELIREWVGERLRAA